MKRLYPQFKPVFKMRAQQRNQLIAPQKGGTENTIWLPEPTEENDIFLQGAGPRFILLPVPALRSVTQRPFNTTRLNTFNAESSN